MAQQTAVERLLNNMPDISHYIPIGVTIELHAKFQEAERMHKEQIIGTYVHLKMKNNKLPYGMKYVMKLQKIEDEAEQYYNETFGK